MDKMAGRTAAADLSRGRHVSRCLAGSIQVQVLRTSTALYVRNSRPSATRARTWLAELTTALSHAHAHAQRNPRQRQSTPRMCMLAAAGSAMYAAHAPPAPMHSTPALRCPEPLADGRCQCHFNLHTSGTRSNPRPAHGPIESLSLSDLKPSHLARPAKTSSTPTTTSRPLSLPLQPPPLARAPRDHCCSTPNIYITDPAPTRPPRRASLPFQLD